MSWRFSSEPYGYTANFSGLRDLLRGLQRIYREREEECRARLRRFSVPSSSESRNWSFDEYQEVLSDVNVHLLGGEDRFGSGFGSSFQTLHTHSIEQLLQAEFGYGALQKTYEMVRNNEEGGFSGILDVLLRQVIRRDTQAAMRAEVLGYLRQLEDEHGILQANRSTPGYDAKLESYWSAERALWGEYKRLARDVLPEQLVAESDAVSMANKRIEDFLIEYPALVKGMRLF